MNPALTPQELQRLAVNAGCAAVGVAGPDYVDRLADAGLPTVWTATDLIADGCADGAACRQRRQ